MSAADDTEVKLYEAYVMFFNSSRTELSFKLECYDFSNSSIKGSIKSICELGASLHYFEAVVQIKETEHILSHDNLLKLLKMILLFCNTPYDKDYNISFHFTPTWFVCDRIILRSVLDHFQNAFSQ